MPFFPCLQEGLESSWAEAVWSPLGCQGGMGGVGAAWALPGVGEPGWAESSGRTKGDPAYHEDQSQLCALHRDTPTNPKTAPKHGQREQRGSSSALEMP